MSMYVSEEAKRTIRRTFTLIVDAIGVFRETLAYEKLEEDGYADEEEFEALCTGARLWIQKSRFELTKREYQELNELLDDLISTDMDWIMEHSSAGEFGPDSKEAKQVVEQYADDMFMILCGTLADYLR